MIMQTFPLEFRAIIDTLPPVDCDFRVIKRAGEHVSFEPAPARTWTHLDTEGHFHAWSTDPDVPYPTLEQHGDSYRCRLCGEPIEPATDPAVKHAVFLPRLTEWVVSVPIRLDMGLRVSVRLVSNDPVEMFGLALVSDVESSRVGTGKWEFRSTLRSTSALGYREGDPHQPAARHVPVDPPGYETAAQAAGDGAGYDQWRK